MFLKMANEYVASPYSHNLGIPAKYTWPNLKAKRGAELEGHYRDEIPRREHLRPEHCVRRRSDRCGRDHYRSDENSNREMKLLRIVKVGRFSLCVNRALASGSWAAGIAACDRY